MAQFLKMELGLNGAKRFEGIQKSPSRALRGIDRGWCRTKKSTFYIRYFSTGRDLCQWPLFGRRRRGRDGFPFLAAEGGERDECGNLMLYTWIQRMASMCSPCFYGVLFQVTQERGLCLEKRREALPHQRLYCSFVALQLRLQEGNLNLQILVFLRQGGEQVCPTHCDRRH